MKSNKNVSLGGEKLDPNAELNLDLEDLAQDLVDDDPWEEEINLINEAI